MSSMKFSWVVIQNVDKKVLMFDDAGQLAVVMTDTPGQGHSLAKYPHITNNDKTLNGFPNEFRSLMDFRPTSPVLDPVKFQEFLQVIQEGNRGIYGRDEN